MANKTLDFSTMTLDELNALIQSAQNEKKVKKAKYDRANLATMLEPLFDAIDVTIADSPDLQSFIQEKDALRIYFTRDGDSAPVVGRETYRAYKSKAFNGGTSEGSGNGGGKAVEVDVKGDGNWQAYKSHAEACRAVGIDYGTNSPVRALHANLPDDRIRSVTNN